MTLGLSAHNKHANRSVFARAKHRNMATTIIFTFDVDTFNAQLKCYIWVYESLNCFTSKT
jgi:hypothetical protein